MNVQVNKNHYFNPKYNHKARWLSYWYQIDLVLGTRCKSVLEVGKGAGISADFLKNTGLEVKTLDIDKDLEPDILGSVENMELGDGVFDCILAAEILEHLPYEKFEKCLKEMRRVSKSYAVISLPDARRTLINFYLKIPFLSFLGLFIKIPSFIEHRFDGQHYWEIGKINYSPERIKKAIINSGWNIKKEFTPQDVPTKRFYLLSEPPS